MEDVLKSARKAHNEAEKKYWGKRSSSISVMEIRELYNVIAREPVDGVCMAFDYGFIKGIRYQQAQERKKVAKAAKE